jgi:hypothetical protein
MAADHRFGADALHAMLNGRLPGAGGEPTPDEREAVEELQYAGELMVVQFFALFRSLMKPK